MKSTEASKREKYHDKIAILAVVRASDTEPSTLDELGVSRQRLAEWRDVRDAGIPVVEKAIEQALADGRAPTKADIQRAVQGKPHVSNNSGENEWYTPTVFIEAARDVMGKIDCDPASPHAVQQIGGHDERAPRLRAEDPRPRMGAKARTLTGKVVPARASNAPVSRWGRLTGSEMNDL